MDDSKKVGPRLSQFRADRGMTVDALSARCGVPAETIEAIEAGQMSPSIAPLVKLSRALGVRLGTFLDDAGGRGPVVCRGGQASEVMRAPGQVSAKMGAMSFYSLAKDKAGRSMEPFIVDVRPIPGDEANLSSHEGEEFIYVLQGEVEVRYGSDTRALVAGDSIYYDSIVPHRVSSKAPARLLAVVYAPF